MCMGGQSEPNHHYSLMHAQYWQRCYRKWFVLSSSFAEDKIVIKEHMQTQTAYALSFKLPSAPNITG